MITVILFLITKFICVRKLSCTSHTNYEQTLSETKTMHTKRLFNRGVAHSWRRWKNIHNAIVFESFKWIYSNAHNRTSTDAPALAARPSSLDSQIRRGFCLSFCFVSFLQFSLNKLDDISSQSSDAFCHTEHRVLLVVLSIYLLHIFLGLLQSHLSLLRSLCAI